MKTILLTLSTCALLVAGGCQDKHEPTKPTVAVQNAR